MKNIKKFETFVNEELDTDTYLSAADKLKTIGHRNRAEKLRDYANNQTKKVTPLEIELYGKKYLLTDDNIIVNNESDGEIFLEIIYDKEQSEAIKTGDYESIWNNLPNDKKESFHKENQSLFTDEEWDEMVLAGNALNNKWSEMSEDEQEFFKEWNSMNQVISGVHIYDSGVDVDGIIIKDRKNAFKLMKFLKEYANLSGGKIKDKLSKISVNDLYHD